MDRRKSQLGSLTAAVRWVVCLVALGVATVTRGENRMWTVPVEVTPSDTDTRGAGLIMSVSIVGMCPEPRIGNARLDGDLTAVG